MCVCVFEGESVACITEIKNDDTDVGKLEPCALSVGMYNGAAHRRQQDGRSSESQR